MLKTANFPLQITFRNLAPSQDLTEIIEKRAAKLSTFYNHITGGTVTVEVPHRPRQDSKHYHIRIALTVPAGELVVNHSPSSNSKYEEVYVTIREAFDEMRRQLQDYARRERGDVKTHPKLPQGQISKLFPQEGYGFIKLADGREIYFHQKSVLDQGFDHLAPGTTVSFVEESGEEGPQATTVRPVE